MLKTRQDEIKVIQKQYSEFYTIIGGLVILGIGFMLGAVWFQGDDNGFGYTTNLYTEIISIGITVLILDRLSQRRDDRKQAQRDKLAKEEQRKRDQLQVVSELQRVQTIEERQAILDRMKGGNLFQGASLWKVNLEGGNLAEANLQEMMLMNASLQATDLRGAKIERCFLWDTYFRNALLQDTSFKESDLHGADLQATFSKDADFQNAILQGVNMLGAYLEGANFQDANIKPIQYQTIPLKYLDQDIDEIYSESTLKFITLPDGTEWKHYTDIYRFTDINHPEFETTFERINIIRIEMGLKPFDNYMRLHIPF